MAAMDNRQTLDSDRDAKDTLEPFNDANTIHKILRRVTDLDYSESDCWEIAGYQNPTGGHVYVYTPDHPDKAPSHRVMARVRLSDDDSVPSDWHCHHVCENPACVNPSHLTWLSPRDHAIETHRRLVEQRDEDDLTADDIRQIRQRYETEDITQSELAEAYDLSQQMISYIVRREKYSYID